VSNPVPNARHDDATAAAAPPATTPMAVTASPPGPASSDEALDAELRRAVHETYAAAALVPDASLCCVPGASWELPGLHVPPVMHEMNYGCGTTVNPADLAGSRPILYVGVGGGLEALQFAYFRRRPGGVLAVDPVPEMRAAAERNLLLAARDNPWFRPEFVRLIDGSADALPVESGSVDVVAQNCLFNVFTDGDLRAALAEVHRVLAPGGRYSGSDPIATEPIPEALQRDTSLRARCCSGCRTFEEAVAALEAAGFGQLVVRARQPYRLLTREEFPVLRAPLLLESLDLLAVKLGADAPRARMAVFTGRTAIYTGQGTLPWRAGLSLRAGIPVPVSDGAAAELAARADVRLTPPTWHARGAGCC
jgi:SAM-dependent methyltransferase